MPLSIDRTLQINIRMENSRLAFDFGRFVGIMSGYRKGKVIGSSFPVARVGTNGNSERSQIVRVWKSDRSDTSAVEFVNVWRITL